MGFLCYLSEYLIPVLIFYILADGIFSGTSVYDEFVKGASEGVRTSIPDLSDTGGTHDCGRDAACFRCA